MRAVIQRVKRASVEIGDETIASIGRGLLLLVGFGDGDDEEILDWMAKKVVSLRVFEDEAGRMNLSIDDVGGEILVVSQFTLYGDCRKGRRPSFDKSAPPEVASRLYEAFLDRLKSRTGLAVRSGVFREHMHVSLVNDGPVTLLIEKEAA
jgi:D-tyrosyl-tRNA(Tyr) deacylase